MPCCNNKKKCVTQTTTILMPNDFNIQSKLHHVWEELIFLRLGQWERNPRFVWDGLGRLWGTTRMVAEMNKSPWFFHSFIFKDSISCSPSWSQICYTAKDDLTGMYHPTHLCWGTSPGPCACYQPRCIPAAFSLTSVEGRVQMKHICLKDKLLSK